MFGAPVSAAVALLLEERGVTVYASSFGAPVRPGWLNVSPGGWQLSVDRS